MNVEEAVRRFIAKERLFDDCDDLHLVALSGGADSVALLLVLKSLGYRLEAVHCNFQLRGDESLRDEQFVRSLCELENIPLHLIHFDTVTYASVHQVSIEMAARELRYRYFEQLRQDIGAVSVCVAHHQDDAVETLLMNLVRGTGIHGLTGIRPCNGYVVRPLLAVSRAEIIQYLDAIGQDYVTDSTNLVPDVVRNKLRLEVLPLLREINPAVSDNIARSARYMADHAHNFSFICRDGKWRLAPAYDLTNDCTLGEHASTINFKGLPSDEDLIVVGTNIRMTRARCQQIIEEVREGTQELKKYY